VHHSKIDSRLAAQGQDQLSRPAHCRSAQRPTAVETRPNVRSAPYSSDGWFDLNLLPFRRKCSTLVHTIPTHVPALSEQASASVQLVSHPAPILPYRPHMKSIWHCCARYPSPASPAPQSGSPELAPGALVDHPSLIGSPTRARPVTGRRRARCMGRGAAGDTNRHHVRFAIALRTAPRHGCLCDAADQRPEHARRGHPSRSHAVRTNVGLGVSFGRRAQRASVGDWIPAPFLRISRVRARLVQACTKDFVSATRHWS
jgi:hypothetical protein